jgi:hypothetical protein
MVVMTVLKYSNKEAHKVGPADKKIKVHGWAREVSPFWDLVWMHSSFYDCFSICLLHIKHLGLQGTFHHQINMF